MVLWLLHQDMMEVSQVLPSLIRVELAIGEERLVLEEVIEVLIGSLIGVEGLKIASDLLPVRALRSGSGSAVGGITFPNEGSMGW